MKNITPGHRYELENFEGNDKPGQIIQFIEKVPKATLNANVTDASYPGELVTLHDGTTNEEVMAMIIDRMNYLQSKFPCRENAIAITHFETGLMWLEKRTADRLKRGVEGKHLK